MTSTAASAPTQIPPADSAQRDQPGSRPRGAGRSRGRGRGRGGVPSETTRDESLNFVPPNVLSQHAQHAQTGSRSGGGNSQRANRARGGARGRGAVMVVQGREFGGALTTGESPPTHISSTLQGDAPDFTPGQGVPAPKTQDRSRSKQPQRKRRTTKSSAPDIATRIHEDIDNKLYECPICTTELTRNSKVWSCHTCWTVFHLTCIKQWYTNTDAQNAERQRNGETLTAESKQWRCPGCNLPQESTPSLYTCWCGKELDPRPVSGLPPHSCGQTCGKERAVPKKCPHPCELSCHAGPCPPCGRMGPTQRCFCGKESTTRRCVDTDYDDGWSCGQICGDFMPCGEHSCPRECHQGLCGACEVRVDARCYCGKEEKAILCCDRDDDILTKRTHFKEDKDRVVEEWTGIFQCPNICERVFECGVHHCSKPCHSLSTEFEKCPWSPELVTRCPCGKASLKELLAAPRVSCEDVVPTCGKTCSKILPCGHTCQDECHSGQCMPCMQRTAINCRCGRTTTTIICHEALEEIPQCSRICRAGLNCGRHECGEQCCQGEKKAAERQSSKRKHKPLNISNAIHLADSFEAEHICTRSCDRLLKCGNHFCQELCHKGPCGTCREAIFEEISCHCGRTVLQPPLPCGTKAPVCRYECERPKACGHPQVQHNCHSDDESCPKCPYLTEKNCMCGKSKLKNIPCWSIEVRCGELCGKKLKCGLHSCRKTCHRPGDCEAITGTACGQTCAKPKKICGHPCEQKCHAPYPCREETPCTHRTIVTCPCQRKRQEAKCNASRKTHSLEQPSTSSEGQGKPDQQLACDEECARLARNRQLAHALSIDPDTHTDDHIPYTDETLEMYTDLGPRWSQEQEKLFRVFADDDSERRLRFKPMPQAQRAFLHAVAEDYGLDSESMDPEPHRHVCVFKTPRFVSAPRKTIREALRVRQQQSRAAKPPPSSLSTAAPTTSSTKEPYNAILLLNPAHGLTIDDLATTLALSNSPHLRPPSLEIHFLPFARSDHHVALCPSASSPLADLKSQLTRLLVPAHAQGVELCALDPSRQRVLRREADEVSSSATSAGDGWSRVAAKGATSASAAAAAAAARRGEEQGERSGRFTVLRGLAAGTGGGTLARKKPKRQVQADVVDDWEAAEEEEEKKDDGASGLVSNADVEADVPVTSDAEAAPLENSRAAEKGAESEGDWVTVDKDGSDDEVVGVLGEREEGKE